MDPERISSLPNLGPQSERMLAAAGIDTVRELDELGAIEAYRRILATGERPTVVMLWALEAALLDIDWRALTEEHRDSLRAAHDALVADR